MEEFREAIRKRASRGVPPEVLAQVEEMEVSEVEVVDATVIRVAAERSLREVMEFLVRSGCPEVVDRVYRKVREEATGRAEERQSGD